MVQKEKNIEILRKKAKQNNGVLFTKELKELGIRREILSSLVESGVLVHIKRGVYIFANDIIDEYYLLQLNAPNSIYSLGTALYFHGYSNRVPNIISLTVKKGYNTHRIKNAKIRFKYDKHELFELGLEEIKSPQGMVVRCYNIERTICDIIKNKKDIDPQIFSDALNQYFKNQNINSRRLMEYAKKLKIENEIFKYIEVLT